MTEAADSEASGSEHENPLFADLGVQPEIVQALDRVGITHAFPIQALTLPVALGGHDIIGQAKTGTGKTLGFGIPLLQRVIGPGEAGFTELLAPNKPQALVVVPTRELAVQVAGDLDQASKHRSARVLTVYGGRAYEPQIEALRKGIEIVVGTPGRLLDLAQQKHLDLGNARIVVLDEADEMLDLGFLPDVERILALTPAGRQTMLFSATMPSAVVALARSYMTQPTHIRAHSPDDTGATVSAVAQFAYRAHALDKVEMLARMLQARGRGLTMIFARTKRTVAKVAEELTDRGFAVGAIHGDLGQGAREQALRAFRNGKVDVLVATDVAARGIDVDDVTHVVNYQCPEDEKTYLHRIGRTARAGNTGTAITFVDWDELMRWGLIDKALDLGIPEPVETYSSSPHLFTDLDIPEGTRGMLPRGDRTRAGLDAEEVEDLGETGSRMPRGRGGRDSGRGARGGRDAGRDSGRGGRDAGRDRRGRDRTGDGAAEGAAREGSGYDPGEGAADGDAPRPRRQRQRRRTRAGRPLEETAGSRPSPDGESPARAAVVTEAGSAPGTAEADAGGESARRPRRRRRRGGAKPTAAATD
ncbi:MAG: DEAD/DEAH box helicase [Kineosporiaceae bacterium]|nr:DEAD/DEAH box helicase [Kineosporiaceae bacterium]